jgi:hypothetical protein
MITIYDTILHYHLASSRSNNNLKTVLVCIMAMTITFKKIIYSHSFVCVIRFDVCDERIWLINFITGFIHIIHRAR